MSTQPEELPAIEALLKQIAEADKEIEGYKDRKAALEKEIAYLRGYQDGVSARMEGRE